ncbi:hypothetical protein VE04_08964 [Pseudogymnoascus sp. 24MN13]|nr:hypothetical protein VE04_08964 [Pseudogymnoascus sp. 24MN13]
MQFNTFPTIALLLLGHLSLGEAATNGYTKTCNSIRFTDHPTRGSSWIIVANCKQTSTVYNVDTQLALDKCFGVSKGKIIIKANGGFSLHCRNGKLKNGVLTGTCKDGSKDVTSSVILKWIYEMLIKGSEERWINASDM